MRVCVFVCDACILSLGVCVSVCACEGEESFSFNTAETERHSEMREWNLKRLSVSTFPLCLYHCVNLNRSLHLSVSRSLTNQLCLIFIYLFMY